jgi:hypothetical protein
MFVAKKILFIYGDERIVLGPMGPFGVIPKPFRVESHFEWRVLSK